MKQAYISIIFIHHKEAVKNYLLHRKTEILQNLDIQHCVINHRYYVIHIYHSSVLL